MKFLVTGSKGQLGPEVINILNNKNEEVEGVDVAEMDLSKPESIGEFFVYKKYDAIIHCAALTAVDFAEDNVELCEKINYLSTVELKNQAQKMNAKFVFISTDYVFDGTKKGIYTEEDKPNPKNEYGLSKFKAEQEVLKYEKAFVLRTSWVFGQGKNFVKTMLTLAETKKEINVVSDQIGSPTYAKDLAEMICKVIYSEKYGLYHATSEDFCSWADFAKDIFNCAGLDVNVNKILTKDYKQKANRPLNSRLSKQKLSDNGFGKMPNYKDALKRYMETLSLKKPSVSVLLSSYNGEKYIEELLDSVVGQDGIENHFIVRDDGSKDSTGKILEKYKKEGKIEKLIVDENVGYARSFHRLIVEAPDTEYYAFCDQDDIWDSDKMICAVNMLKKENNDIPLVYWCSYRSIDKDGKVYNKVHKNLKFKNDYDRLANYINFNDVRGFTCVFNKKARDIMVSFKEGSYRYHDWILLLVGLCCGKEICDENPHASYRSHDSNCFGPNDFSIFFMVRGLKFLFTVDMKGNRSKQIKEVYDLFGDKLNEVQRKYIDLALNYKTDKAKKKELLKSKEIKALPFFMRKFIKFEIKTNKY